MIVRPLTNLLIRGGVLRYERIQYTEERDIPVHVSCDGSKRKRPGSMVYAKYVCMNASKHIDIYTNMVART